MFQVLPQGAEGVNPAAATASVQEVKAKIEESVQRVNIQSAPKVEAEQQVGTMQQVAIATGSAPNAQAVSLPIESTATQQQAQVHNSNDCVKNNIHTHTHTITPSHPHSSSSM